MTNVNIPYRKRLRQGNKPPLYTVIHASSHTDNIVYLSVALAEGQVLNGGRYLSLTAEVRAGSPLVEEEGAASRDRKRGGEAPCSP